MKSLLVPYSGKPSSLPMLEAAFKFAKEWKMELRCLHSVADPEALSTVFNEASLYVPSDVRQDISRNGQKQLQQARKSFTAVAEYIGMEAGKDSQAVFLQDSGSFERSIIAHSRFADLIAMHQCGTDSTPEQDMALHAALFETGRPVLLFPLKEAAVPGKHIAIAWNDSKEAALAVHHALPFLRKAAQVSLLHQGKNGKDGAEFDGLRHYLELYGIHFKLHKLPATGDAGQQILEKCQKLGADMLVMGAFSHHRLRQLILGGVTRHMLAHADISLFMAH